jgi:acetylornithine deacetylase
VKGNIKMNVSQDIREKTKDFLMALVAIPSTRGNEGPAARFTYDQFKPIVDHCELIPIDDSIMEDPEYNFPIDGFTYKDTPNLECIIKGEESGKKIVFNAHFDVVPPSEGQFDAFNPKFEDGHIWGRGSLDNKSGIAIGYALALMFKERGIKPKGDLIFHWVIEEENGGNGTLAMIRRGVEADAAISLEPSGMTVRAGYRGAVWFELHVYGRAVHSGKTEGRVSALDKGFEAIKILERYHDRLLAESRGLEYFDEFEDPMPLTIGECHCGVWPAQVPGEAVLKGLIGFLPNRTYREVQQDLRNVLLEEGDEWLRDHFEIKFNMLNNDGYSIPADHPLVTTLGDTIKNHGLPLEVNAATAASDAYMYNNMANIPIVCFGAKPSGVSHQVDERVELDSILKVAEILVDFTDVYC